MRAGWQRAVSCGREGGGTLGARRTRQCRHSGAPSTGAQRLGAVAVPVVRPPESRNVVVPLLSRVAVPVVRPEPSRNVLVPLLSVLTVPVIRPLASRNVVCAAAAVANASRIAANRAVSFIGSPRSVRRAAARNSREAGNSGGRRTAA